MAASCFGDMARLHGGGCLHRILFPFIPHDPPPGPRLADVNFARHVLSSKGPMNMAVGTERTVGLPMYALPEMEEANTAFLAALQQRLCISGVDTSNVRLDHSDRVGLEGAPPL